MAGELPDSQAWASITENGVVHLQHSISSPPEDSEEAPFYSTLAAKAPFFDASRVVPKHMSIKRAIQKNTRLEMRKCDQFPMLDWQHFKFDVSVSELVSFANGYENDCDAFYIGLTVSPFWRFWKADSLSHRGATASSAGCSMKPHCELYNWLFPLSVWNKTYAAWAEKTVIASQIKKFRCCNRGSGGAVFGVPTENIPVYMYLAVVKAGEPYGMHKQGLAALIPIEPYE